MNEILQTAGRAGTVLTRVGVRLEFVPRMGAL
jgi:hypothetical protein